MWPIQSAEVDVHPSKTGASKKSNFYLSGYIKKYLLGRILGLFLQVPTNPPLPKKKNYLPKKKFKKPLVY